AIAIDGLITRFAPTFDVGRHLELVCDRHLKWQLRRSLFTYNALVGWAGSGARMVRDGALRGASFLQKVTAGEVPVRVEISGVSEGADSALRQKAIYLAAVVFTVAVIITATGERVQWGINFFTAETMFVASAVVMLLRTLRRLVKGRINHA